MTIYVNKPFPGGESLLEAVDRISNVIENLPNKQILVIGHRAVYYTLEHLFNKTPFEDLLAANWNWQPGWIYKKSSENNL